MICWMLCTLASTSGDTRPLIALTSVSRAWRMSSGSKPLRRSIAALPGVTNTPIKYNPITTTGQSAPIIPAKKRTRPTSASRLPTMFFVL